MEKPEVQAQNSKPQEEQQKVEINLSVDFGTKKSVVAISKELDSTPRIASNNLSNDQTP
jgi:hypothetical protein